MAKTLSSSASLRTSVTALRGSKGLSYITSCTGDPLIPPALFMSSTAIIGPYFWGWPLGAMGPLSGVRKPILMGAPVGLAAAVVGVAAGFSAGFSAGLVASTLGAAVVGAAAGAALVGVGVGAAAGAQEANKRNNPPTRARKLFLGRAHIS